MKQILLLLLFSFSFFLKNVSAQITPKSTLQHNQNSSYVTYDELFNNFDKDILIELSLQHNFYFNYKKFLPKFWLEINPEVTIRMLDSTFTAQTAKFNVDLKLYYNLSKNKNSKLAYFGFGHHSNGKYQPFINPETREIDMQNGDFATDYFQAGIVSEKVFGKNDNQFFLQNYSFEYHPGFYKNSRRRNLYKLYNEYRIGGKWQWLSGTSTDKTRFSATLKTQVLLENFNEGSIKDKIITDFRFAYQPNFLKMPGFWLFVQGYYGEDYYQIYFVNKAKFVRIGLTIRAWGEG